MGCVKSIPGIISACFSSKKAEPPLLDQKIIQRWKKLGWDETLLKSHPDFCQFIIDTRVGLALKGYQNTCPTESMKEAIHIEKGTPHLLVEGQWTSWEVFKATFHYDPITHQIRDSKESEWNYLYDPSTKQEGFIRAKRYGSVHPIYQLNETEKKAVGLSEKGCALQIFTSERNGFKRVVSHVGFRLINSDGWVYSHGFETPYEELQYIEEGKGVLGAAGFLTSSCGAKISNLDFDEFEKFKTRRVTTLQIYPNQFDAALQRIDGYTGKHLRFNMIRQNCGTFVLDIMKSIGLATPNVCCTTRAFLWDLVKEIPFFGPILDRIVAAVQTFFVELAALPMIGIPFRGVNYLASTIATFCANLLIYSLGATIGNQTVSDEHDLDNEPGKKGLTYFKCLVTQWSDLLKLRTDQIYSQARFAKWQLEDKKEETVVFHYEGPRLYIAPSST